MKSDRMAERIKRARESVNLTQAQLAEKVETTPQNISQYERGIRKPKYETVQKIADALAVDINWLLNGSTLEEHNEAFIRQLQHKEPMSARELYLQKYPDDEPAPPQKRNFDLQWLAENFTADEIKMLETYAEFLLSKRDASQRSTDAAQSAAGDTGDKEPEEK